MRTSKASRTQQPFVAVQEPGKGKALLHVLADGRNTGHYKLSERKLTEVGGNVGKRQQRQASVPGGGGKLWTRWSLMSRATASSLCLQRSLNCPTPCKHST